MKHHFNNSRVRQYYHFLIAFAVINICGGAAVPQVKTRSKLTTPSTTPATIEKLSITVTTAKPNGQTALDYDYHDFGQPSGTNQPRVQGGGTTRAAGGNPQYVKATTGERLPPSTNWETPLMGMDGIWGERYEWLRGQVRKLHRHGLKDQLASLQEMYPKVNLTLLYDHYANRGMDYEMDESQYYYHNGSYHWRPGYGDMEDGYWYNDTYYPGEMEGPEREDGYFYNGTWYAGAQDMEDGYFYNGTYYPGEVELPEAEDGYYYNNTYYPGYELEGFGQEETEPEDLMWWQLHHPKWRYIGTNNVNNKKPHVPPLPLQQQQPSFRKWEGLPAPPAPGTHQQQWPQIPQQRQQPHAVPQAPQKLPMVQQRLPPKRPPNSPKRPPNSPNRPSQLPFQAQMVGAAPKQQPSSAHSSVLSPSGPANSGNVANSGNPGNAALMGSQPQNEANPSVSKTISPTISWGIVFAAILGASIILAPLACLLYKYRQEKRIKKRTILRRPEHGSVDDGIMDALIMKELGEKKDSRVRQIDKGREGKWKPEKRREMISRMGSIPMPLSRTRSELQSLPTSSTFANVHDEPRVIIT